MLAPGYFLINRYEILEKIGSGGMADVYKAMDHTLNRYVAVKVLKPEYSTDATFVKKFRVEAQSAGALSHPNIVNIYDVGETLGIHFIVMELVQGITLKNYIDMKGKLDIREALNISVQIASGLSAAHENRIIHRDIKPQNIIMSRDGKVKVTDFGIAKVADSTTVTTTAAGTVYYISPEQARGGYSDEKSDIYSLGITMFEMVTGQVPFDGESNVAVALMHIQNEMPSPRLYDSNIPKSFEKIILKCTQKKPDWRYTSAKALIADLRRVLTQPDGAYIMLAGAMPMGGGTIDMAEDDVVSLKKASLSRGTTDRMETRVAAGYNTGKASAAAGYSAGKASAEKKLNDYRAKVEDDEDEEDDDSLSRIMLILGIIASVILVIIIFVIIANALGLFGGSSKKPNIETETEIVTESETETEAVVMVSVPSLTGKTQDEIETLLSSLGLSAEFVEGASESYSAGEAYDQSPASGVELEEGEMVTVYISTGKETFTLSDVTGMDYTKAQAQLESTGLDTTLEFQYSTSVAEDKVISTSPEAGSQVSKGDTVTIIISQGEETKTTTVPDILNDDLETAIEKLEAAGLKIGNQTSEYSDNYEEGTVSAQSPAAGKLVEEGTTVSVTVSLGKKVVTYSAKITIPSPFGSAIEVDGESVILTEGRVTLYLEQDGAVQSIYDADVDESSIKSSITWKSESSSTGTVTAYVDGILYDTWTVSFN